MKINWRGLKKRRGDTDIARLFLTFLMIIFGLALTPTVGDSVYSALWNSSNVSTRGMTNLTNTAVRSLLELIPLIWVFIILGIGAAVVVSMFEDM